MIEKKQQQLQEEGVTKKPDMKLVDGYPDAYKERLAKIDLYKKILHDVLDGVKYRSKMYPKVVYEKLSKPSRFLYEASRVCVSSLVDGQVYPISFKINGEVYREIFWGRLSASVIVSGAYGSTMFFSFLWWVFKLVVKALSTVLGFSMNIKYVKVALLLMSLFIFMYFVPFVLLAGSVMFDIAFWIVGELLSSGMWVPLSVVFGYLGYKKSKNFIGLKPSWNLLIDGIVNKKSKKKDVE